MRAKMKQVVARVIYGAHCVNRLAFEERRWAVKVFSKGEPARFVAAIQLPLPKIPLQGWVEPSTRSIDELPKYFQLTEKIEADIFEVDQLSEDSELVVRTKG
jgi:hypothetical protein